MGEISRDPRFAELQRRHDARGLTIQARIWVFRLLMIASFPTLLIFHLAYGLFVGARGACEEVAYGWTDAARILLQRDALKLRKLVYGRHSQ